MQNSRSIVKVVLIALISTSSMSAKNPSFMSTSSTKYNVDNVGGFQATQNNVSIKVNKLKAGKHITTKASLFKDLTPLSINIKNYSNKPLYVSRHDIGLPIVKERLIKKRVLRKTYKYWLVPASIFSVLAIAPVIPYLTVVAIVSPYHFITKYIPSLGGAFGVGSVFSIPFVTGAAISNKLRKSSLKKKRLMTTKNTVINPGERVQKVFYVNKYFYTPFFSIKLRDADNNINKFNVKMS